MDGPDKVELSVELLSLDTGLYLFSMRPGTAHSRNRGGLLAPAVRILPAPGITDKDVLIVAGPGNDGPWLRQAGERLILRVARGPVRVLLTTLQAEGAAPVDIAMERLDRVRTIARSKPVVARAAPPVPVAADQPRKAAGPAEAASPDRAVKPERRRLRLQLTAHVKGRGALRFAGREWAGCRGERLPIERFSILPLEEIAASDIEYKALTASGVETPWVSNDAPCGAELLADALVGFAVRLKRRAGAPLYDCEYRGAFLSGKAAGPFRNGIPCQSIVPDDPLEAIEFSLVERASAYRRPARTGAVPPLRRAAAVTSPASSPAPATLPLLAEPVGG